MNKIFNETLIKLIDEWFENRNHLPNYDYTMLRNLALISMNRKPIKKQNSNEEQPKGI